MTVHLMRTRLSSLSVLVCAALAGCNADAPANLEIEASADRSENISAEAPSAGTASITVQLSPRAGVSGQQRVNFAVPLPPGLLTNASQVRVMRSGAEIPAGRRSLASHPDGSVRSVQIQFDLQISGSTSVEVRVGEAPQTASVALVPVANTLVLNNGSDIPRVWAVLPASWLSSSGAFGPQVTSASVAGTPLAIWDDHCDYTQYDVDSFLAQKSDGTVWLYDRGTTMYRGYARTGVLSPLTSAYRETSIYRRGLTGSGSSLAIGVPGKASDLKYYYAQNMAIHYLLTGDDRFRESAEQVAYKMSLMWDPWYDGGFWTERHAGFQLLAYTWAAMVSDDRASEFRDLADDAADAVLDVQASNPPGYNSTTARCFAHTASAHGEDFGYWGCSPWMSAILADGLDAYATLRGGSRATSARQSIVKLGRIIAQQGRDGDGRPVYWMGVGNSNDEVDDYEEHWGEAAYVVAMAWFHGGKQDSSLKQAADQLTEGFADHGVLPHMRSFNWQCRSAVATPYYLKP